MAKDFSKPGGVRLRIVLQRYDPSTRRFNPVKNAAGLVNVPDGRAQTKLWRAIERTIQEESDAASSAGPVSADSAAAV